MKTAEEREGAARAVLSPLACRLEARAKLAGVSHGGADPEEVRVLFAPWHLESADRAVWEHGDSLVLLGPTGATRELPERETSQLWELRGPRNELESLAQETEGWAALEAAHRNAHSAPDEPVLMGIVNVTPDSFSDGGRFLDPDAAVEHGLQLEREGAAWLDVGGESTRPGSEGVGEAEELERVLPVVEGLRVSSR